MPLLLLGATGVLLAALLDQMPEEREASPPSDKDPYDSDTGGGLLIDDADPTGGEDDSPNGAQFPHVTPSANALSGQELRARLHARHHAERAELLSQLSELGPRLEDPNEAWTQLADRHTAERQKFD